MLLFAVYIFYDDYFQIIAPSQRNGIRVLYFNTSILYLPEIRFYSGHSQNPNLHSLEVF